MVIYHHQVITLHKCKPIGRKIGMLKIGFVRRAFGVRITIRVSCFLQAQFRVAIDVRFQSKQINALPVNH